MDQWATLFFGGVCRLDKNVFVFTYFDTYKILTLTIRGSYFSSLRSVGLCITIYNEKENNILGTKAKRKPGFLLIKHLNNEYVSSARFRA